MEAKAKLATLDVEQAREEYHRVAKMQLEQAVADLERRTIHARSPGTW